MFCFGGHDVSHDPSFCLVKLPDIIQGDDGKNMCLIVNRTIHPW